MAEMEDDDNSHYLLYRVLGVPEEEGRQIDRYQNKGRLLYRYAGTFLEEAARVCFLETSPDAVPARVPNVIGERPRRFGIDLLLPGGEALEIKWKDATTDGDHINKENARLQSVQAAGYRPIRVMFYRPHRVLARRVQAKLEALYQQAGGEYHCGEAAWAFVRDQTGVDLHWALQGIAVSEPPG